MIKSSALPPHLPTLECSDMSLQLTVKSSRTCSRTASLSQELNFKVGEEKSRADEAPGVPAKIVVRMARKDVLGRFSVGSWQRRSEDR